MERAVKPCESMRFKKSSREYVVVSVGGSLIVPDQISVPFLSTLRELVLNKTRAGLSFFIIAGGGKLARRYQDAAHEVRGDLDEKISIGWVSILRVLMLTSCALSFTKKLRHVL